MGRFTRTPVTGSSSLALARAQRERSRHKRGSHRYRRGTAEMARLKHKEANRRKDALHKLSRSLINDNDVIVHEDLRISNMSRSAKGTVESPGRNVSAKSHLNDALMDSSCGHVASENREKQKFACLSCGFTEHADINAARNILRAGLAQGGIGDDPVNVEPVIR